MTVRARAKAVEHMPDWAKCCQGHADSYNFGEINIVRTEPRAAHSAQCSHCGHPAPGGVNAVDEQGLLTPIECLDLDEGPMTTAERNRA